MTLAKTSGAMEPAGLGLALVCLLLSIDTVRASEASREEAVTGQGATKMCSRAFHDDLANKVHPAAIELPALIKDMRTAVDAHPGRWMFWANSGVTARGRRLRRLEKAPQLLVSGGQMCVHSVLARGGRIRCLKWRTKPQNYQPPPLPADDAEGLEVTAMDRRAARALSGVVRSRGAFPRYRHGAAAFHLVKRTADEVIAYAKQPYRETICTGAVEMADFYTRRLAKLTAEVEAAETLLVGLREAAGKAVAAATSPNSSEQSSAVDADTDWASAIREVVAPYASGEALGGLKSKSDAFAVLAQAREFLNVDAMAETAAERRKATLRAMRSIEFALHAEFKHRQLKALAGQFGRVFHGIRVAHAANCMCDS